MKRLQYNDFVAKAKYAFSRVYYYFPKIASIVLTDGTINLIGIRRENYTAMNDNEAKL